MFSSQNSQVSSAANYIEDVFSTYLYTGNGSTQTITNGIDLAGKGGLVWVKDRGNARIHWLANTEQGYSKYLSSNATTASTTATNGITSFNSDGFSLGANSVVNGTSGYGPFASWTFRKQPKFFDVVTYTGNGVDGRTISHNLGATPGCVIVKRTDSTGDWVVRHTAGGGINLLLNTTVAGDDPTTYVNGNVSGFSSTTFTVSSGTTINAVNANGATYVAYLFAHNAGGFGLTGTDNVISCGTFTTNVSGEASITLGYEPQFVIIKATSSSDSWVIQDNMRGLTVTNTGSYLRANTTDTEAAANYVRPKATGFDAVNLSQATHIYIAIRRPMKVPTSGASVFQPVAYTGTSVDNRLVNTGIVTDMTMARIRADTSAGGFYVADRLRGDQFVATALSDAETTDLDAFMTPTVGWGNSFSAMNGFGVGNDGVRKLNQTSTTQLAYAFKRASGFFDEIWYTGTGANQTLSHNLQAVPELIIVKNRSGVRDWGTGWASIGWGGRGPALNSNEIAYASVPTWWNSTAPTASAFTVGSSATTNGSGSNFVAYLFATCAGVSKVGSYTGNGSTQTINCGFTGGARFVLIKSTTAVESWHIFDTARGMVAGTDPRLRVNTTDSELNNNWVYTATTGFEIVTSDAAVNGTGQTYIFLAIA